mgnify:FL=1
MKLDTGENLGGYEARAMASDARLELSFETNVPGIHADWLIESGNGDSVTGWDGNTLTKNNNHIHQSDSSGSVNATFCVPDASEPLGCKIDAEWLIWLFLHDSNGNTRITNITVFTNDTAADYENPIAEITIVEDTVFEQLVESAGSVQSPTRDRIDTDGDGELDYFVYIDSHK